MKLLLIILVVLMAQGCRTYSVHKVAPDGSTIEIKVQSSADIEAPYIHYERVGNDAVFDFSAENVDSNTEDFMNMFQGMMGMMMEMMKASMLMSVPTAVTNTPHIRTDEAGNVWINGKANPPLPLNQN